MLDKLKPPFEVLLTDCLLVEPGDEILVIFDETASEYWTDLLDAIRVKCCSATFIHLPLRIQEDLAKKGSVNDEVPLPYGLVVSMNEVDVILTILSGDISLSRVRRAVVNRAIGQAKPGKRLAHIPGISREILGLLTQSPIKDIEESCEAVAWALGEAHEARLVTTDAAGEAYFLTCALNGWLNEPLMSPGVIYPNSWGNLPPGETFCCPFPPGVSGTVVINGSIPDHACADGEEAVLYFERSKLVKWVTTSPRLQAFFDGQELEGTQRGDEHWNTFAELGVGLNPIITTLSGNSLFDEKAYGTVHIAIGDNVVFGHTVKSRIHADLVIKRPSLYLDGRPIIEDGNVLTADIHDWRSQLDPSPCIARSLRKLVVRRETFEQGAQSQSPFSRWPNAFSRRLHSRGRTGYVRIANGTDAVALQHLASILAGDEPSADHQLAQVVHHSGLDHDLLGRLLGLLAHYRMVLLDPDPTGGKSA